MAPDDEAVTNSNEMDIIMPTSHSEKVKDSFIEAEDGSIMEELDDLEIPAPMEIDDDGDDDDNMEEIFNEDKAAGRLPTLCIANVHSSLFQVIITIKVDCLSEVDIT